MNVGGVREVVWRGAAVRTAIWKSSVGARAVHIEGVNVAGDDQADRGAHGGPDKAVYAYAMEDYVYWYAGEGLAIEPGRFGENLTTEGLNLRAAVIGEWWRVGTAVLEVAQPRFPCFKLGLRMQDAGFPKRFLAARRLGAYLRIVQPGVVRVSDEIQVERQPGQHATLGDAVAALTDRARASTVLSVPQLAARWREMVLARHGDLRDQGSSAR